MERAGRILALAAAILAAAPAGTRAVGPEALRVQQLRPIQLDPASVGMAECFSPGELQEGTTLAVCRAPDVKGAGGQMHLMVVDRSAGGTKVLYRSPGSGDSYYLRPTVLGGGGGDPTVVLAEAGAEFSYGIEVYVIEPDRKVLRAGFLDLAAPAAEEGPTSAVPFAQVERMGSGLCFRFTRDLLRSRPDGGYAKVPRAKAVYKYEKGRKLVPVKSCDPAGK